MPEHPPEEHNKYYETSDATDKFSITKYYFSGKKKLCSRRNNNCYKEIKEREILMYTVKKEWVFIDEV